MKASIIRLYSGIKIDENNVTNLNTLQLLTQLEQHKEFEYHNMSLVLTNFTLEIPQSYFDVKDCNYMAFLNTGYTTKWYFAFINNVKYVSDKTTRITFTIDYWSTYFGDIDLLDCFVEREITASDEIGEHTLDEGLAVEKINCLESESIQELQNTKFYIGAFCGYDPDSDTIYQRNYVANRQMFAYGLILFKIQIVSDFNNFFEYIKELNRSTNASIEDMHDVFIVPDGLVDENSLNPHGWQDENQNSYTYYTGGINPMLINSLTKHVDKLYEVEGKYQPQNNKCYCYPYNYMIVTNNAGNTQTLEYEEFKGEDCEFRVEMALSIGISARCVPVQYKDIGLNYLHQLPMAKLPTCSWSADSYVNWLTQNAINIQSQIFDLGSKTMGSLSQYAGGLLLEAQGLIPEDTHESLHAGGVIQDALNLYGEFYKAQLLPDVQHGSNLGDVNFSAFTSGFSFKKMRVDDEVMKTIDDYFTKFGYKINRVKTPNLTTSRFNHFYIKIGKGEKCIAGEISKEGIDAMNSQLTNGLTIWKSLENIGNYGG